MKEIILSSGVITQVSVEDYDYLIQWNWHNNYSKGSVYRTAEKAPNRWSVYMNREIAIRMNISIANMIDHKDRNYLNNQRSNLRSATYSQNAINTALNIANTSGYKGVTWDKKNQLWFVKIKFEGKSIHIGRFDCIIKAAQKYDHFAKRLYGEFAYLNFPGG